MARLDSVLRSRAIWHLAIPLSRASYDDPNSTHPASILCSHSWNLVHLIKRNIKKYMDIYAYLPYVLLLKFAALCCISQSSVCIANGYTVTISLAPIIVLYVKTRRRQKLSSNFHYHVWYIYSGQFKQSPTSPKIIRFGGAIP